MSVMPTTVEQMMMIIMDSLVRYTFVAGFSSVMCMYVCTYVYIDWTTHADEMEVCIPHNAEPLSQAIVDSSWGLDGTHACIYR